jgi:hypothetical protein
MPDQTVAPRKDARKVDIYSRSRGNELMARDPGFEYVLKPRDPKHPDSVYKKLVPHEIGDASTGFAMVDAWEVVRSGTAKQGAKRADDASGSLDGAEGHGDQIWIRTPKENYAKYAAIEELRCARQAKSINSGERAGRRGEVITKAIAHTGYAEDGAYGADVNQLLGQVS